MRFLVRFFVFASMFIIALCMSGLCVEAAKPVPEPAPEVKLSTDPRQIVLDEAYKFNKIVRFATFSNIYTLSEFRSTSKLLVPGLVYVLKDPSRDRRLSAVRILGNIGDSSPLVLRALAETVCVEPDWSVRRYALESLGALGSAAGNTIPAVIKATRDPYDSVRTQAYKTLGMIGGKRAEEVLPVLIAGLSDCNTEVCKSALLGIGRLGKAGRPALEPVLKALSQWNVILSSNVQEMLLAIASPEELKAYRKHPDEKVRDAIRNCVNLAMRRRWENNSSKRARLLEKPLLALESYDGNKRHVGAREIGKLKPLPDEALVPLIQALVRFNNDSPQEVIKTLAKYGPAAKAALPELRKYLTVNNERTRIFAAAAILDITGQEMAPPSRADGVVSVTFPRLVRQVSVAQPAGWNPFKPTVRERVLWALMHFIWQGAAISIVVAVALFLARHSGAQVGYAISYYGMLLMALVFLMTFFGAPGLPRWQVKQDMVLPQQEVVLYRPASTATAPSSRPTSVASSTAPATQAVGVSPATRIADGVNTTIVAPPKFTPNPIPIFEPQPYKPPRVFSAQMKPWMSGLVYAWLAGVVGLGLWRIMQLRFARNLLQYTEPIVLPEVLRAFRHVRWAMNQTSIQVAASIRVMVPTVVGWLDPVVLIPKCVLEKLPIEQLTAVIAHEFAHVKRKDNLANMVQVMIETLLFYHPCVWWISRRVRLEREHCCDDIALKACDSRMNYAQGLTEVARLALGQQACPGAMFMAADGGDGQKFYDRIRRIIGKEQRRRRRWSTLIAVVLVLGGIVGGGLLGGRYSDVEAIANWSSLSQAEQQEVIDDLFDDLADWKRTFNAQHTLGQLKSPLVVPRLLKMLKYGDVKAKKQAWRIISIMGPEAYQTTPELLRELKHEEHYGTMDALLSIGPKALPYIMESLKDPEPATYERIQRYFGGIQNRLLFRQGEDQPQYYSYSLEQRFAAHLQKEMEKALCDTSYYVRRNAVMVMTSRMGWLSIEYSQSVLPVLMEMLGDEDGKIRQHAYSMLPSAYKLKALKSPNSAIRLNVLQMLYGDVTFSGMPLRQLLALAKSLDAKERRLALDILKARSYRMNLTEILKALNSQDVHTKLAGIDVAVTFGLENRTIREKVGQLIGDKDPAVSSAAMLGPIQYNWIGPKESVFLRALERQNLLVRSRAAVILSHRHSRSVKRAKLLPLLYVALRDKDTTVRRRAFGPWLQTEPSYAKRVETYCRLMLEDKDPTIRKWAIRRMRYESSRRSMKVIDQLLATLQKSTPEQRRDSGKLYSAAKTEYHNMVPSLVLALASEDDVVVDDARDFLNGNRPMWQLCDKSAIEPMRKALTHRNPEVRAFAASILMWLNPPEGEDEMLQKFNTDGVRSSLYARVQVMKALPFATPEMQRKGAVYISETFEYYSLTNTFIDCMYNLGPNAKDALPILKANRSTFINAGIWTKVKRLINQIKSPAGSKPTQEETE